MKGFNKKNVGKVCTVSSQNRTSNGFKLEKYRFRKAIHRNMMVEDWNRLGHQVVMHRQYGALKDD